MKLKKAFTLIELLIVISIIGILSTLAIGNYSNLRSSIENQFTVDTLVQEIRRQSQLAQNQQTPTCYNIYFDSTENLIIKFPTQFDTTTRTCQTRDAENNQNLLEDSELIISQVLVDTQEQDSYQLTFIPPQGKPLNTNQNQQVEISLQPPNQPENKKTILINLQNGSIQEK